MLKGAILALVLMLGVVPLGFSTNKQLTINAHGDYIAIPDDDSLDITGSITIEAWIQLLDNQNGTFFRKEHSYFLEIEQDRPCFAVGSDTEGWKILACNTPSLEVGIWYHVAAVYNQEVGQIFINGELRVEENLSEYTGKIMESSNDLAIGYWGEPFIGHVDEIRLWNVARTQEQIKTAMTSITGNIIFSGDLVGYWNFDSGTLRDFSPFANDGVSRGKAKITTSDWRQFSTGDVSGNGTISAYDAALILQYVIGLIDQFPADTTIGQAARKYTSGEITVRELEKLLRILGYPINSQTRLLQNYPNPFNPETWIPFQLAKNTLVTISIHNAKGQLIRIFHLGNRKSGMYVTKNNATNWDGRDNYGDKVTSGVYFYTLQSNEFRATRKMTILK